MYVIYVQTTLIQTDTNDTMYQRKTVKFVFLKKIFSGTYHIYNPNSGNVGVSTISRFCEIQPFRNEIQHFANEIPHFRERDTTQPVIFAQNRPFFAPVFDRFSLELYQIHFDTKYNSTNTSKRWAIFYGHLLERYRFLGFRLNTVFSSSWHLNRRKFVKTPQTTHNTRYCRQAIERNGMTERFCRMKVFASRLAYHLNEVNTSKHRRPRTIFGAV